VTHLAHLQVNHSIPGLVLVLGMSVHEVDLVVLRSLLEAVVLKSLLEFEIELHFE
jgi:hypothetical protein